MGSENAGQIAAVCTKLRELATISNMQKLTELLTAAEQEAYRVQFAYLAEKTKSRIEQKMQDFVSRLPGKVAVTQDNKTSTGGRS
jgi:hypothetical protein